MSAWVEGARKFVHRGQCRASRGREVHVWLFEGAKCHITIWTVLLWVPNDLLLHAHSFWLEDQQGRIIATSTGEVRIWRGRESRSMGSGPTRRIN